MRTITAIAVLAITSQAIKLRDGSGDSEVDESGATAAEEGGSGTIDDYIAKFEEATGIEWGTLEEDMQTGIAEEMTKLFIGTADREPTGLAEGTTIDEWTANWGTATIY